MLNVYCPPRTNVMVGFLPSTPLNDISLLYVSLDTLNSSVNAAIDENTSTESGPCGNQ